VGSENVLENFLTSWKVLDFLSVREWEPCRQWYCCTSQSCNGVTYTVIAEYTLWEMLYQCCCWLAQVGYEVGSGGSRLPDYCMNDLDEKLIPVINSAVNPPSSGQPIVLELIFYILHQLPSVPTAWRLTDLDALLDHHMLQFLTHSVIWLYAMISDRSIFCVLCSI